MRGGRGKTTVLRRSGRAAAEAVLRASGFGHAPGPGAFESLMPWRCGDDVVYLMEDDLTGNTLLVAEREVRLPDGLPRMPPAEIDSLLSSNAPRDRLAGLQAAATLDASARLPRAAKLLGDCEDVVARQAAAIVAACLQDAVLETVTDPAAALFALPGWRRETLQMMRWWMHDRPSDPGKVEPAVARALTDPDWEVAVTAMLTAGALGLAALAPAIVKAVLPGGPRDGATRDECRLVLALRDACLTRLGRPAGKTLPPGVAEVLDGTPDALPPELRHFAAALSLPLPIGAEPEALPGIEVTAAGPRLADGRLLAWVPPGRYRLGDTALPKDVLPNPPRVQPLTSGFYIDAEPRPPVPWDKARATAEALSGRTGLSVALASREAFEMAVRGADGRRFPWGMSWKSRIDLSPAGLSGLLEGPGEWLDSMEDSFAPVAGGDTGPIPAHHRRANKRERRPYRLIFSARMAPLKGGGVPL